MFVANSLGEQIYFILKPTEVSGAVHTSSECLCSKKADFFYSATVSNCLHIIKSECPVPRQTWSQFTEQFHLILQRTFYTTGEVSPGPGRAPGLSS